MPSAIITSELRKRYGSVTALHSLNLVVERGTIFGLIGPNGAGKTTALRMLLDIIHPTSGTVRVLGQDPRTAGPQLRRRIGFVPGDLRLDGRIRGRTLLAHYAEISGPVAPGTIDALAERLQLDLNPPIRALSKGNRQKIGLVQAFMHKPELLVLDEPTSGIDPLVQREFLLMLREARENGQTVLLSSHVLSEIQQAADQVALISRGRIVAQGGVESLRLGDIRRLRAGLADTTADAVLAVLSPLPHLHDIEVTEGDVVRVTARVNGDIDGVVKALARFRITDLAIEEPDLEESVLSLYGEQAPDAGGGNR